MTTNGQQKCNKSCPTNCQLQKKINKINCLDKQGNYYVNRLVPRGDDKTIGSCVNPFTKISTDTLYATNILPCKNGLTIGASGNRYNEVWVDDLYVSDHTINFSNGSKLTELANGCLVTTSSSGVTGLICPNSQPFGLKGPTGPTGKQGETGTVLVVNSFGSTPPSEGGTGPEPPDGSLYLDTTTGFVYCWDGDEWDLLPGGASVPQGPQGIQGI